MKSLQITSLVWTVVIFMGLCIVSNVAQCTDRGRFSNNKVENCRGYTMCLNDASGSFIQYDLSCPATFIYSHIDSQCTNSTSYQCLPTYNCTGIGLFENNKSESCSSYIACVKGVNNVISARLIACPSDTLFSRIESACVNQTSYTCDRSPESNVLNVTNQIEDKTSKSFGSKFSSNSALLFFVLVYYYFSS